MKFNEFLKDFVPKVARKTTQLNKAYWILETTGSPDAADLKSDLDTELKMIFNCPETYKKLLSWVDEPLSSEDARQLDVLIRAFKQNQVPVKILEEISKKEALLAQTYANYRPVLGGKEKSENEIRNILKNENDPAIRKEAWEASKEIGGALAPQILTLVKLRNEAAHSLGYSDYFQMQLDLQEVDPEWLLNTLDDLSRKSEKGYLEVLAEIEKGQSERFKVPVSELGASNALFNAFNSNVLAL